MVSRLVRGVFVLGCLAAFALGGAALAGAFHDGDAAPVSPDEAAQAGTAGLRAVEGGELLSVERTDDGAATWDVDVVRDGQEVEVLLDENLAVVHTERDWERVASPDTRGFGEADDRSLSAEKARHAGEAAVRAAGGGSIESVERSDDPGVSYEIEVVRPGQEIDIALDEDLQLVRSAGHDD